MFSIVPKSVLPFHLILGMVTVNPHYPVVVHQADKNWEIAILEKLTLELIGSLKVLGSLCSWDVLLRECKLGNCCSQPLRAEDVVRVEQSMPRKQEVPVWSPAPRKQGIVVRL